MGAKKSKWLEDLKAAERSGLKLRDGLKNPFTKALPGH